MLIFMKLSSQQYQADFESARFVEIFQKFKHFLWPVEKEAGDFLVEKLHEQWQDPANKDHLHVLEIGCGNGAMTKHVLHQLKSDYKVGSYTGLDVSAALLHTAKKELHTLSSESHELFLQDANTYQTDKKYDLILSLNSWYGLEKDKIAYYQSLLTPTGILVILINSQKNLIWQMRHLYDAQLLASQDIKAYLDTNAIFFKEWAWNSRKWHRSQFCNPIGIKPEAIPFFQYVTREEKLDQTLKNIVANMPPAAFSLAQEVFFIYPPEKLKKD